MRSLSMLVLGTLFGTLFAAAPAHADQCAKNPRSIADQGAALVKKGATVVQFCEPCGDVAPGTPYTVQSVASRDGEVLINGVATDLAYLFVQTGPDELVNVGMRAGCGPSDVSEAIRGGKPTGPLKARSSPQPAGRVPLPPPPPRATSAAELAGTWSVRLTTRYSSCAATPSPAFAEWTIAYDQGQGQLELISDAGTELTGALDASRPSSLFRATLKPKQRPSAGAVHVSMFLKDRMSGWVITSVRTQAKADPICVIYQDMQATRR
ncbi:MAG TPA: hypothetical protein VNO30_03590 [Kofleriaceae bacterium]|nr:hypothetical protein [Kofleriaceae bacterium]